ncbi:MAG: serine hydrolase, partial [bacterium]|nr:serine hydrolase [bacterium]
MSDTVTDQLNTYMDGLVKKEGFNGSVLVARKGELFLEKGYGRANIELDVPNTPQTKFRIGSITKPFTSLCTMILQERGDLNVEDALENYLPDIPEAWRGITLHHLLTHTSGIMHSWALPGFIKT